MQNNALKIYISIAVILFGFAAVYGLSNFLEANQPELPESYADEDLSLQGKNLKGYTLGAEGLIADWYWMRSLQYLGEKIQNSKQEVIDIGDLRSLDPKLLYPYLDNATTLDPQFMVAYSYGAVVLPAIDPKLAIKIAEKGIANNPDEWRLYQHLGYTYWKLKDYKKAAEIYEKGATIKDAPPFMKAMAAKMENEGGSRDTSRQIYEQMFKDAQDSQTKDMAKLRLSELDSLDERDAIDQVLKEFSEKNSRCAKSWQEILPLLGKVKLPYGKDFRVDKSGNIVDPTDVPYLIDQEKCVAILDSKKTKIPLY